MKIFLISLIVILLIIPLFAEDYQLIENGIKRISDGTCIPICEGNRVYQEYKKWLAKGNTPKPQFTAEELQAQADLAVKQAEQKKAADDLRKLDIDTIKDIDEIKAALKLIQKQYE